jgi:hypothetical protein
MWLEKYLQIFIRKIDEFNDLPEVERYHVWDNVIGSISCDGDKCTGYRNIWEKEGIPYHKGVAIYLLTKSPPFSSQVRDTENGWVPPVQWVIDNKDKFLPLMVDMP